MLYEEKMLILVHRRDGVLKFMIRIWSASNEGFRINSGQKGEMGGENTYRRKIRRHHVYFVTNHSQGNLSRSVRPDSLSQGGLFP